MIYYDLFQYFFFGNFKLNGHVVTFFSSNAEAKWDKIKKKLFFYFFLKDKIFLEGVHPSHPIHPPVTLLVSQE